MHTLRASYTDADLENSKKKNVKKSISFAISYWILWQKIDMVFLHNIWSNT